MITTFSDEGFFNKRPGQGGFQWNKNFMWNTGYSKNKPVQPDKPDEREDELNMAEFYSYEGIRNGGTFKLDATTTTTLGKNTSDIVGKVVTITGNYTVGYGTSGDRPLGFVEQIEKEDSRSNQLIVSVVWNQSRENITCAGTETAGKYLACNGTGGFALSGTSSAPITSNAIAYGVDATEKTCTAYIHG